MNFEVTLEDGRLVGPNRLQSPSPRGHLGVAGEGLSEGNKLIFGIRPEDINIGTSLSETPRVSFNCEDCSELLGAESHLYCAVSA